MSRPIVYAIVITCNGEAWIRKCLGSLEESSVHIHIVVVDNLSVDGVRKMIREDFPDVELVEAEKNLGFGQANNIGFRKALNAKAGYVFLLNQDAWVDSGTIEKLIDVSGRHPEYGILSPWHMNYEGTDTERYFEEWVVAHYTPGLKGDKDQRKLKEIYESEFVHAACWLMPLSTIERVGGFDPLFFHYGEDNDYVQRLQYHGLKAGIIPEALFYHQGTNEGLGHPERALRFQVNRSLILLKSPEASDSGALTLFVRQFFKAQSGDDKIRAKAYRLNLKRIYKVWKSRREQKLPLAYIN